MRLQVVKSKNAASLYIVKSIYENGKRTSKVVEKLGTYDHLLKSLHGQDPIEWGKSYAEELTKKEKEGHNAILIKYLPSKQIEKNNHRHFNGGYLFLQSLYSDLGLDLICKEIATRHKFTFNLDAILSRLLYARIIFPTSKLATFQLSKNFLEPPDFEIQHLYRGLEVIASESDFIQAALYKNSLSLAKRNDRILYYDCTNYFFEIEQAEGLKQYGPSKEHRPNPIVEMGLFMDGDGIPLAFSLHPGNTNEQITLRPLEERLINDFKLSTFVVCTDAGLSSNTNRKFNNKENRAFITTQSIKKLKQYLKQWALSASGWFLAGDKKNQTYDLSFIEGDASQKERYQSATFYKERWVKEDGLEQKLIVTFSFKFQDYQRHIRNSQIDRAKKILSSQAFDLKKHRQNDYKRFIKSTSITADGEIASKNVYILNQETILKEELYDGFYAVCTNLEDDPSEIAKINHRRWEIEECFRIMKTDFKARPVYLKRDDRIKAHFTTCFLALTLYRYLEKKLEHRYTTSEIIQGLREMNFYEIPNEGYLPTYTRTDFTDALHEAFGFHTDYQMITKKQMKKIFETTKK